MSFCIYPKGRQWWWPCGWGWQWWKEDLCRHSTDAQAETKPGPAGLLSPTEGAWHTESQVWAWKISKILVSASYPRYRSLSLFRFYFFIYQKKNFCSCSLRQNWPISDFWKYFLESYSIFKGLLPFALLPQGYYFCANWFSNLQEMVSVEERTFPIMSSLPTFLPSF